MKIITYPASQRTFFTEGIYYLYLNKEYNNKQYIVYNTNDGVYISSMNTDGTNWDTNKISNNTFPNGVACDIYNGILYFTTSQGSLLKYNIIDNLVISNTINDNIYGYIKFDFPNNKIYYESSNYTNSVILTTTDLDGNNSSSITISIGSIFNVSNYLYTSVKCGEKYLFSWKHSNTGIFYIFSCNLDGTNKITVNTGLSLQPSSMVSDNTNVYMSLYDNSYNINYGRCNSDGSGFINIIKDNEKRVNDFIILNGSLYYILSNDINSIINVINCDLNGSNWIEINSYELNTDWFVNLIVSVENSIIYVWGKSDSNEYEQLWTYPGKNNTDLSTNAPWPKFQSNIEHTGYSNNSVTILSNPAFTWKYNITNDDLFSDIVIDADNTIYFGTKLGKVIALNSDGTLKWECDLSWEELDYEGNTVTITPDLHYGCPAIATDGTIYVASGSESDNDYFNGSGRLFAINPNGTLKWVYRIDTGVHYTKPSPITIAHDGTILFSSYYPYAVNPDGTRKWSSSFGYTFSTPILYNDYIYGLGTAGGLRIVSLINGEMISDWVNVTGSPDIQPIIGNSIYAGSPLKSINLLTGVTEWEYNLTSINPNSISYGSNNTIYFCKGLNIYALNIDGTLKWTYLLSESSVYGNIVIDSNNNIYFITYYNDGIANKNKLYCLNSEGNLIYEKILNDTIGYCNLAIGGDGYLYGSSQNYIVKIGDYINPILPQVQCRATQIIVSANTGKIILAVPIL